jgi:division protein CdvB (Snf7/Vps24/ESCRT-III family)
LNIGELFLIKDFFQKTKKPINELVLETVKELSKCYSRIELTSSKLEQRNERLFDSCSFYMKKGSLERATVYANEISEIRKVLSILLHTELSVERTILRLDTIRTVTPTLDSLEEIFGDVKTALGLVVKIIPSITPEINRLSSVVNEIVEGTKFDLEMPAPKIINNPNTEMILKEAANVIEEDLQRKIPEPPTKLDIQTSTPKKQLIALSTNGSENIIGRNDSIIRKDDLSNIYDVSLFLLEELILDYVERNSGNMNVAKCSKELNISPTKVKTALGSLSKKNKIMIQ